MDEAAQLSELVAAAIGAKMQQHRQQEQQQVDALLASQKYLTSNLRTLINSLDTMLQLSTPRYSSSQGDLVSSCVTRARAMGHKLDAVAARLARIQKHLEQEEAKCGLQAAADTQAAPPAPEAAAAADAGDNAQQQQDTKQQPQEQEQPQEQPQEQEQEQQRPEQQQQQSPGG